MVLLPKFPGCSRIKTHEFAMAAACHAAAEKFPGSGVVVPQPAVSEPETAVNTVVVLNGSSSGLNSPTRRPSRWTMELSRARRNEIQKFPGGTYIGSPASIIAWATGVASVPIVTVTVGCRGVNCIGTDKVNCVGLSTER